MTLYSSSEELARFIDRIIETSTLDTGPLFVNDLDGNVMLGFSIVTVTICR